VKERTVTDHADGIAPTYQAPATTTTTGRYLVLLRGDDIADAASALREMTSADVATSSDFPSESVPAQALEAEGTVVFEQLGVAVVSAPPDRVPEMSMAVRDRRAIIAMEPERYVYPSGAATGPPLGRYLQGYRDGVDGLARTLTSAQGGAVPGAAAVDESQHTWGVQHTGVSVSGFTGMGIRVAVLDTGMDLGHPDFASRAISAESFVAGQEVQDVHGHGTHCIGTACGPLGPGQPPRYGVAHGAEIFAGKVLSNEGSGTDGQILAGMNWAVANGCRIVSMSLGAATTPGQAHSAAYEQAAERALQAGTLIIAAAGNDSRRSTGVIRPVAHPANCPSIMAVGAVNMDFGLADFTNSSITPDGGEVDIAGPGVAVHSSWPVPTTYRTISGTSMATPHVAGIAALWLEARPQTTATELFGLLMRTAQRLGLPSTDAGAGLVQAP
jgi:subtilisin family serine protease